MRLTINRAAFLEAWKVVAPVVPLKSPKPILASIKLIADDDGVELLATDLEVGVRQRVLGVTIDEPGCAILPTEQVGKILSTGATGGMFDELIIEVANDELTVKGIQSEFSFPTEDPDLFPDVPRFDEVSYYIVAASDLKKMIRRTIFATDDVSTRYALGGVLFEADELHVTMVGTDGRRLARMTCDYNIEDHPKLSIPPPVLPTKALKLIDRHLKDDMPPVHVAFRDGVLVRSEGLTLYSRLVEGRFPRYQDVFPGAAKHTIDLEVKPFLAAVQQAAIVTSEESKGVDFCFSPGLLTLKAQSSGKGRSSITVPIQYTGDPMIIAMIPNYVTEAIRTLDESATPKLGIIDGNCAVVFSTQDRYAYVVMPLTRDRS